MARKKNRDNRPTSAVDDFVRMTSAVLSKPPQNATAIEIIQHARGQERIASTPQMAEVLTAYKGLMEARIVQINTETQLLLSDSATPQSTP